MSLSPEDLAAIALLLDQKLDQKLAAQQASDARRRRFWVWFWLVVFIVTTAASTWAGWRLVERAQDEVTRINLEFSEAKLAYQQQLEQDRKLQAERIAAEKAVHYRSDQTEAQHEAGLIGDFIGLLGSQADFQKKWANADFSDPAQLQAYANDLNGIIDQGLKPLGQVVLRNTDPAHNTANEKMRQDAPAAALPVASTAPSEAPVQPAATREPAAAPALAAPAK